MNVLGYILFALTFIGFLLIFTGYAMLIRQAMRSPDRRAALRRVAIGTTSYATPLERRAAMLIGAGAFCGVIVFTSLIIFVFLIPS